MEVSGAGKAWNDRKFCYWIYWVSNAVARAKWLHCLPHKTSRRIAEMDTTGQIFQISKFPDMCLFVIIPWMFWRNLTKIGEIYIPYKSVQSGCIPPKIKWEILAYKRFANNSRHARRLTANQWDRGNSWRKWRWIKISREKWPIADMFFWISIA